jgi:hypothetical protein
MSWFLISDAQLWFPDEGMAKSGDDEVKSITWDSGQRHATR